MGTPTSQLNFQTVAATTVASSADKTTAALVSDSSMVILAKVADIPAAGVNLLYTKNCKAAAAVPTARRYLNHVIRGKLELLLG